MNFAEPLAVLILFLTLPFTYTAHVQKTATEGIEHSIALQEKMEEKLRETFKILFDNFTRESNTYSRTFMYVCDGNCVANYRYENGVASSFLLALLSERKFSIFPHKDTPFYSFYEEGTYSWKTDLKQLLNKTRSPMTPKSRYKPRFRADLQVLEKKLSIMDFELHFKDEIITLSDSYDWILDLRRHPNTAKKIPWLFSTHASDFIRLLHNGLFRLIQPIRNAISAEIIEKAGNYKLVCFNSNRNPRLQIQTFLSFPRKNYGSNYKFYISGIPENSPIFKSNLNDKIAKINNGKIVKTLMNHTRIHNQNMLQKLIDIHILKVCDVLVLSESSSGFLAAHLRRKEDDLYCFRNGVIFPCSRRLIGRSFRDGQHKPEHIDVDYYCRRNDTECTVKHN